MADARRLFYDDLVGYFNNYDGESMSEDSDCTVKEVETDFEDF